MHVFGLWEEARLHVDNMQTPHRKAMEPQGIDTQFCPSLDTHLK